MRYVQHPLGVCKVVPSVGVLVQLVAVVVLFVVVVVVVEAAVAAVFVMH